MRPLLLYVLLLLITSCASTHRIRSDAQRGLMTIIANTDDVTFTQSYDRRAPFEKGTSGNIAYVSKTLADAFDITCDVKDGTIPREQVEKLPADQRAIISTWLARGVKFSDNRTSVSLRCIPMAIDASVVCVTTLRDSATNWEVPWQLEPNSDNAVAPAYDSSLVVPFDMKELQKNVIYPKRMRDLGFTSKTVIRVLLDECGKIECYKRDSTQRPEFNEAALKAIFATQFRASADPKRSSRYWISIPFNFRFR
ncbi:MAG TPA: energy transducer TonB [Chlorobiota bacterium]|nr:energy transducer TonB [Chlorobiota bacterium]